MTGVQRVRLITQQNFITPTKMTTLIITGVQRIRLITNKISLHQQRRLC